jgi:hypothetical protein
VPGFVIATLGVRVVGVPRMFVSLLKARSSSVLLVFLALFVVCGYALSLGTRVTPIDYPDDYNNSVWFIVESKLISWIFVGLVIGTLFKTWSPRRAALLTAAQILAFALPGGLNTFSAGAKNGAPTLASEADVNVANHFRRSVKSGAVVLCDSPIVTRLLLGVASARVPFAPDYYVASFLRKHEIGERTADVSAFWASWAIGQFRADLAAKYGLEYVVASQPLAGHTPSFSTASSFVYSVSTLASRAR